MNRYFLKLDKYMYLEDENESLIIFKILNRNNEVVSVKKLSYECNPILDVEILNLRDTELIKVIKKLHKMGIDNDFKNRFLIPIKNFKKDLISEFYPEVIQSNPTVH